MGENTTREEYLQLLRDVAEKKKDYLKSLILTYLT